MMPRIKFRLFQGLALLLVVCVQAVYADDGQIIGLGDGVDLAWSSDGQLLAVSSITGIRLYDMATPDQPRLMVVPDGGVVHRLAFSPDGQELAGITEDLRLIRWSLIDGQAWTRFLDTDNNLDFRGGGALAYSGDGVWLAYGYDKLTLLDRQTGISDLIPLPYTLSDVVFSPDHQFVVAFMATWGDADMGGLIVADRDTREIVYAHQDYIGGIESGMFSPDGRYIYAFLWGGEQVLAWDTQSQYAFNPAPELTDPTLIPHGDGRIYSPDRQRYALYTDGKVQIITELSSAYHSRYTLLAISPDDRYVATYDDRSIHLIHLADGLILERLSFPDRMVKKLAFSSDGRLGALMANGDVYQWGWEDGTIAVNPPPRPALVNGRGETTVAYHDLAWDGGQFVVFGCGDGQQVGQEIGRGDFILTADLSYIDNVHHVMLAECTQTPIITNANGSAGVSLAQDGETIQVIRADGSLIAEIPYPASLPQAFGLNGDATRLMIGMGQQALGGGAVDIQISEWRLDGTPPQEILILRDCWETCEQPSGLGLIRAIAYHPTDDSIFAVGSGDIDRENYVQIWRVSDDPAGGELLFQSPKLPRPIRALAFTSDGRLIATGEDGLIRIWDIPN